MGSAGSRVHPCWLRIGPVEFRLRKTLFGSLPETSTWAFNKKPTSRRVLGLPRRIHKWLRALECAAGAGSLIVGADNGKLGISFA